MQTIIGVFAMAEILFLLSFLLILPVTLLCMAFWIWMLVDCALNEPSEGNDKLVWIIIILFANFIGALIYFLARRPQRKAKYGK
ncbi:MAG TPA: PLD nuclease N-terminal domain-containing protein [Verrucomicrobiota bacterium]|nr:PLD nuclease N-terminal domain-containing protein [Verrucomicrobiota bacterium]